MWLRAHQLGHRFTDDWVFQGVDLNVTGGTSVAVVGPSGVGKTTLLSLLGGLLSPGAGTVELLDDDRQPVDAGEHARSCSWVLQTTNAFGNRSVADNVTAPLRLAGLGHGEAQRRCASELRKVGLDTFAARRARSLSGGELQRLGIARALALRAPVVLADEPTGQLDTDSSAHVARLLVSAADHGALVVVVTHDPAVAQACSTVLTLGADGLRPSSASSVS